MATAGGSKTKPGPQADRIYEVKDILYPFNKQLNLSEAFNWKRDDIYGWLKKVVENEKNVFGLAEDTLQDLKKIEEELRDLSLLDGKDYIAPELKPDQHIFREKNKEWPPPPGQPAPPWDKACELKVRGHYHNNRLYSSPYDLLGLFLSTLGPAPDGATKANFYLPLTAVYSWWCSQIAGERVMNSGTRKAGEKLITEGTGWFPAMFQCTWRQKDGQLDQFFLGSSTAGFPKGIPKKPQMTVEELEQVDADDKWELAVKYGRYKLIEGIVVPCGFNFEDSPLIKKSGDLGTRYGNCAETAPFSKLMRNGTDADGEFHGLALKRAWISATAANYTKEVTKTSFRKNLAGPCDNCKALIQLFQADSSSFDALRGFEVLYP